MKILLEVEVEKTDGKFCAKDDVIQAVCDQLDGTDIEVEDSTYEILSCGEYIKPMPATKKVAPA